jgi:hypothetical protein
MNVRIPFQRSAKSMKDTNKARNKVLTFVYSVEHLKNNAADSLEKTVKKGAVFQKERAKFFINGKNAVAVSAADKLKGHHGRAVNAVLVATSWAKPGMAAKGNEFKFTAVRTAIHGTTKRGITTMNHL